MIKASVSVSGVFKTPVRRTVFGGDVANGQRVRVVLVDRDTRGGTRRDSSTTIDVLKTVFPLPIDGFLEIGLTWKLDRVSDMRSAIIVTVGLR